MTADSSSAAILQTHLLDSFYETASLLAKGRSEADICQNLLLGALGSVGVTRGVVLLQRDEGVEVVASCGRSFDSEGLPRGAMLGPELDGALAGDTPLCRALVDGGLELGIGLRIAERTIGLLCLGKAIGGDRLGEVALQYLRAMAGFHAVSIRDAQDCARLSTINDDLERRNTELQSLFELSKQSAATIEEREILDLLVFSLMGGLAISRVTVLLAEGKRWTPVVEKGAALSDELIDALPAPGEETGDWNVAGSVAGLPAAKRLGAILPMKAPSGLSALIVVGRPMSGKTLSRDDRRLISTHASVALGAVENARLFQDTLERQRLDRELAIARTIQQGLSPQSLPEIAGIEIAALTKPSREVGGDLFEAVRLDDGSALFAVADVTDKGVPAALLAASIQAAIRTLARTGLPIDEIACRINSLVWEQTDAAHFATCFFARYDPASSELSTCSAGHDPALLFSPQGGEAVQLSEGGLLLGVMPSAEYEVERRTMKEGSALAIYTDGLTEAQAPSAYRDCDEDEDDEGDDEELGMTGLEAIIARALAGESLDGALGTILEDVDRFTEGAPPSDDRTLLLLRR